MNLHSAKKNTHYPPANHQAIHAGTRVIIKESGHQHQWLEGGYDLEKGYF